jgi:radical SAM family RiPP maturation amino acid epimerase
MNIQSDIRNVRPADTNDVRPIVFARANADDDYRHDLGHTKRFIERWYADQKFRDLAAVDARKAAENYGLIKDPEEIRILWDPTFRAEAPKDMPLTLAVRRYLSYQREKAIGRDRYRKLSAPDNPRLAAWRARMVARCVSHLGGYKAEYVVHAPVCYELSKGCSVGCWFCSVSAPRLTDQFRHAPENARLWKETLTTFRDVMGPSAGMGFCYWASDPLDNPDYEDFLCDFHDCYGEFPQTTTAQPQKHVERVKKLLLLSEERGGFIDRFSILTLRQWNEILEAFDPADLIFVECIAQNKEAFNSSKSISGRALDLHRKRVARHQEDRVADDATFTTACVSGFLVNMVDRTVRVITPCHANERWKLGYWVLAQGTFQDGASLRKLLDRMIEDHMPTSVRHDRTIAFRSDLAFTEQDDGFVLTNRFRRHTARHDQTTRLLGSMIATGKHSAFDIATEAQRTFDTPLEHTFMWLNRLFDGGLLHEEPDGAQDDLGMWIPAPQTTNPEVSTKEKHNGR